MKHIAPLVAASLLLLVTTHTHAQLTTYDFHNWSAYGGDAANSQYSSLDQINTANAAQLKIAWTYNSGGASDRGNSQIQCNPIIINGTLYATSPQLHLFALDAATGEQLWRLNPATLGIQSGGSGINRGVVYWQNQSATDQRILYTAGDKLLAINADTGRLITTFGDNGTLDLHEGLGRDVSALYVNARTPGIIYNNLLILGSSLSEGPATAPGHIRAYNVITGKLEWIFHTIPLPGQFGYESWPPDAYQRIGGANAWSGMSLDHERGIVFVPTGSPAFDFWGGNRIGSNLFGNCLIALEAATGKRLWHFQFVHHDLWDRDVPAAPNLVTVEHQGRTIDAVAQIAKTGHIFLFDRETGTPLFPITEQPFPPSDIRGELAWPTQPLPLKPPPLTRQSFTESDVTDLTPQSHAAVLQRLRTLRTGGQYLPPSTQGTIVFPGFDGGGMWGGAAYDPTNNYLYVNTKERPCILTLVDLDEETRGFTGGHALYTVHCGACHGLERQGNPTVNYPELKNIAQRLTRDQAAEQINKGKGFMPAFAFLSQQQRDQILDYLYEIHGNDANQTVDPNAAPTDQPAAKPVSSPFDDDPIHSVRASSFAGSPYAHKGYERFFDPEGYPAVKPPWGLMSAVDLNKGEIVWQVPLGEHDELTARGIPITGTANYGGPAVTAGGLIFIAATSDERFRAIDKQTGETLFQAQLPAAGYATPAVYSVGGRQFVVIACGGGKLGTKSGDAYIAFALPE